ncbi:MAG: Cof-type HAD-IIB family hydrolase [Cylindrospermopsis raciborskii]|jgi:Cof subfamily protein (haloacid dehalogenase superfamily)|uniref:Cof-type HAD-IIB family hydrolase n=1 Tax=Cylindrospermopsis raciborskii TaxID=77022 RepID=UPI003D0AF505
MEVCFIMVSINNQPIISGEIKLLVLDIDGTIAGHDNQISETVKMAIAKVQSQGIQVAIATGRMYCSALRFHQDIKSSLPLMAYQGAWIQNPHTGELHRHLAVSKSIADQLLDYFEQPDLRPLLSVHFYVGDQLYVREMTTETTIYVERCGVTPLAIGDLRQLLTDRDSSLGPTKVLALSHDVDLIQELLGKLRLQYTPAELYMTTSVSTFLEVTNPFVNKGTAVRYLAEELLGLTSDNVMTIGDNFNDLEMLEYAGIGVAMGGAPQPVQAIANWVTSSVEEDGVAIAIEKFLVQ